MKWLGKMLTTWGVVLVFGGSAGALEYVAGVFNTEGSPLPHATVAVLQLRCWGCEESDIVWEGQTDAKGFARFELEPNPAQDKSLRVFAAKAEGYAPSFRDEESLPEYKVQQEDAARLLFGLRPIVYQTTGTVVDGTGQPVTDAEIGFYVARLPRKQEFYCPEFWGTCTDETGRFAYGLPESRLLKAKVLHPDYARESVYLGRISERFPRPKPVNVEMRPGLNVLGTVTFGRSREPAANAVVRLMLRRNCKCSSFVSQTTADEEGNYAFRGLPSGYVIPETCRLWVEHPRKAVLASDEWRGDVEFSWPPNQLSVVRDLHFEEGVSVAGRVVHGRKDEPVAFSQVMFRTARGRHATTTTEKDGTFRFAVEPGTVDIEVEADIDGKTQVRRRTVYPAAGKDLTGVVIRFG